MPTPDEDADDSTALQPNRFGLDDELVELVTDDRVDDELVERVTDDDATDQLVEQVARQWGTPEGEWWP